MFNDYGSFSRRPSKLRMVMGWIWAALIIPVLAMVFSTTMFALFIVSFPIMLLWNHYWVTTFPAFHPIEFLTTFGILVMVRLIFAAVTK